MCGRFYFDLKDGKEFEHLKSKILENKIVDYVKQEVFPSQSSIVLVNGDKGYEVKIMQWGFHTDYGQFLINARSETIEKKPSYAPYVKQRCLIPCNGFYEWKHKQKYFIEEEQTSLFYLAGIYNDADEFVIVTGQSEYDMACIHDRTPIMINEKEINSYLNNESSFNVYNDNLKVTKVNNYE